MAEAGAVFRKWRGRGPLPGGRSVDAYLANARAAPRAEAFSVSAGAEITSKPKRPPKFASPFCVFCASVRPPSAMSTVTLDPSPAAPAHLGESAWQARAAAHDARVRVWTDAQQARASRGEKHPVFDFLFSYYSFRPAWLRRWHPGPDLALTGEAARAYLRWSEYHEIARGTDVPPVNAPASQSSEPAACVTASEHSTGVPRVIYGTPAVALAPLPSSRRHYVIWLRALLRATQSRPAFFGCYGLHEWAMVYRQTPDEVRHNAHPLRFAPDPLARIVEAAPITCSHFDAFRFFTPPARPLNKLTPARETVPQFEQSGCLHANMDLYKWSFKLAPFAPSELIADCFALARDIREVDMRASPYDLRALGFAPITIETAAGRADYETHQRAFTARAAPLRARLLALCERLLA